MGTAPHLRVLLPRLDECSPHIDEPERRGTSNTWKTGNWITRRYHRWACLGFCVNAFSQKWPSRRSPNSIIKRLIAIRQSFSGIVHFWGADWIASHTTFFTESSVGNTLNRPGFPREDFICELRLPDHCFRWKHNKLFPLLPEEYGPAFPAIVDCYRRAWKT